MSFNNEPIKEVMRQIKEMVEQENRKIDEEVDNNLRSGIQMPRPTTPIFIYEGLIESFRQAKIERDKKFRRKEKFLR